MRYPWLRLAIAGTITGTVNGLFGAGGGMVLVPMLAAFTDIREENIFLSSICILLPMCVVSLLLGNNGVTLPIIEALPYLIGGGIGGIAAGLFGKKIPTVWLHRLLGVLILWGGLRYLW